MLLNKQKIWFVVVVLYHISSDTRAAQSLESKQSSTQISWYNKRKSCFMGTTPPQITLPRLKKIYQLKIQERITYQISRGVVASAPDLRACR